MTPSLPKEPVQTNPPPPFPGMETGNKTNYAKTVCSQTLFTKNSVVSYNTNSIYTLLLWNNIGKEITQNRIIQSSIGGKGWGGYHAG